MEVSTVVATNRDLPPFPNRGKRMQFYNTCLEKAEEIYAEYGNIYGPSADAIARACVHVLQDKSVGKPGPLVDGYDVLDHIAHDEVANFIYLICDEVLADNGMSNNHIIRRNNHGKARRLVRLATDLAI